VKIQPTPREHRRPTGAFVAQAGSLLYRRLAVGGLEMPSYSSRRTIAVNVNNVNNVKNSAMIFRMEIRGTIDLSRLGSGERNVGEATGPRGPNERERVSQIFLHSLFGS